MKKRHFFRKTIKHPGCIEGIGLHSGEVMKLTFHPAEEGEGIRFIRKGTSGFDVIPATVDYVIDTSLAVTLGIGDFHVQTVEHLLFAVYVLGITDLTLEVEGHSEIPIMDGSALAFMEVLEECEFHEFSSEMEPLIIDRPVSVSDGNRYLVGMPDDSYKISYTIDFPHPLLKNQSVQMEFDSDEFRQHVGKARTFGFLKEVEALKKMGLAQGGSTENAVVFTPDGVLNEMRFSGEPIYHKILDLVGDLALVGRPIIGHILCSRGGHALDVAFGKKLLKLEKAAREGVAVPA